MIDLALKAGIPVISARTSDTINLAEVLTFWCKETPVVKWPGHSMKIAQDTIYLSVGDGHQVSEKVYHDLIDADSVLVVVNGEEVPFAFDVGEIPVPPQLLLKYLTLAAASDAEKMLPAVRGLTIKSMVEIVRLASVRYGEVTSRGILDIRARVAGRVPGLMEVSTAYKLYLPSTELAAWTDSNKFWFKSSEVYAELRPRGILLAGDPGVGKTAAGRFIAKAWDIPLFHVNLGASLDKFHGVSEANFARLLSAADGEEPCGLLFDEMEKLFAHQEDNGTTSRILGQLLWWMQERTSRVLVIMTTNDLSRIPPEVYRSGRIDKVFKIEKLILSEAQMLAQKVLKTFIPTPSKEQVKEVADALKSRVKFSAEGNKVSPAEVVQTVHDLMKSFINH